MKSAIANLIVYELAGLNESAHLAGALHFFIFEVPKVLMLLVLIVFVVGIVRTYFSPERTRRLLGGKSLIAGKCPRKNLYHR